MVTTRSSRTSSSPSISTPQRAAAASPRPTTTRQPSLVRANGLALHLKKQLIKDIEKAGGFNSIFQSPAKYKEISGFLDRRPNLFSDVEVRNQALRFLKNCRKYNKNGQQYYERVLKPLHLTSVSSSSSSSSSASEEKAEKHEQEQDAAKAKTRSQLREDSSQSSSNSFASLSSSSSGVIEVIEKKKTNYSLGSLTSAPPQPHRGSSFAYSSPSGQQSSEHAGEIMSSSSSFGLGAPIKGECLLPS